jgi:hypothetical protein
VLPAPPWNITGEGAHTLALELANAAMRRLCKQSAPHRVSTIALFTKHHAQHLPYLAVRAAVGHINVITFRPSASIP